MTHVRDLCWITLAAGLLVAMTLATVMVYGAPLDAAVARPVVVAGGGR